MNTATAQAQPDARFSNWKKSGDEIFKDHLKNQWLVVWWVADGVLDFGEDAISEIAKITRYSRTKIYRYVALSNAYARSPDVGTPLKISFWAEALVLPASERLPMLKKAYKSGWTVAQFRAEIANHKSTLKLIDAQREIDKLTQQVTAANDGVGGVALSAQVDMFLSQTVKRQTRDINQQLNAHQQLLLKSTAEFISNEELHGHSKNNIVRKVIASLTDNFNEQRVQIDATISELKKMQDNAGGG